MMKNYQLLSLRGTAIASESSRGAGRSNPERTFDLGSIFGVLTSFFSRLLRRRHCEERFLRRSNLAMTVLFIPFFFLAQTALAVPAKITNVRSSVSAEKARLVFDTSSPVKYKAITSPKKITVSIRNTILATSLKKVKLAKTPIKSISSNKKGNDLKIILNLKKSIKLKHFILSKPNRLVLDLCSEGKNKPKNKAIKRVVEPLLPKKLRNVVIVIDPGHGGKDPGAVGYRKTYEKNINLAVAKELHKKINAMKGFSAYLTRSGDYYVPLRKRLSVAHNHKADIFISIHADAYKNRKAQGASVFALSQRGATSEAAKWLAQKENESELGQVISDKNWLLKSVLIDLAQTAAISSSLEVGVKLLSSLRHTTGLHSNRVEQAAFVVLKSPNVPSLLVEVGFLSNAWEERKLRSKKHQRAIASKLAIGIKSYFKRKPPEDTYLAKWKNKVVAKRG